MPIMGGFVIKHGETPLTVELWCVPPGQMLLDVADGGNFLEKAFPMLNRVTLPERACQKPWFYEAVRVRISLPFGRRIAAITSTVVSVFVLSLTLWLLTCILVAARL
jgi:hypothetical protein